MAVIAAIGLALALVVQTWIVQPFSIPSGSMENTLLIGDRVFVDKLFYRANGVQRGDVIVFSGDESWDKPPGPDPWEPADLVPSGGILGFFSGTDYTKRVIGMPGDTVECCDSERRLLVNGEPLDEPYLFPDSLSTHQEFGPVTVGEGRLWVMGDHRGASHDSRGHSTDPGSDGTIPESSVIGKAFMIHWPFDRFGRLPDS
ncbi:signal peptidase I [Murinocardiopsis flavida]|nr:signal peptidase I [Murinocardiopsis flavida]